MAPTFRDHEIHSNSCSSSPPLKLNEPSTPVVSLCSKRTIEGFLQAEYMTLKHITWLPTFWISLPHLSLPLFVTRVNKFFNEEAVLANLWLNYKHDPNFSPAKIQKKSQFCKIWTLCSTNGIVFNGFSLWKVCSGRQSHECTGQNRHPLGKNVE